MVWYVFSIISFKLYFGKGSDSEKQVTFYEWKGALQTARVKYFVTQMADDDKSLLYGQEWDRSA